MGRVAHVAHDADRFVVPAPYYAGTFSIRKLVGNVGIVGKTMFFPCATQISAIVRLPTLPTIFAA
jgi:hypothetical protein